MGASQRIWLASGWEDPWFEALDSAHKIAFMYLVLGPNARPSGLYVQSTRQMAHALATTPDKVDRVLDDFEADGKVLRDQPRGLVWVVGKAAISELCGLGPGIRRSIEKDVLQHSRSPLAGRFRERYPHLAGEPSARPSSGGSAEASPGGLRPRPGPTPRRAEATSTGRPGAARKPDELWDALIDALNLDPAEITKTRRGRLNAALRDLREVGATPEELRLRAKRYRRIHPEWEFTETALAAHWASLTEKKRRAPIERIADPDPDPLRDDAVNAAGLAQLRAAVKAA